MANIETAITPAPVVTVRNKDGSTATGYTGNITVALATNPTAATLTGTTTIAAAAGVATFSDLELTRSGKGFTLRATAAAQGGYTPRAQVSRPFTIATRLVFTIQPVGVAAPDDIIPPFQVTAQDSLGNTDTAYAGEVTVALYTGAGLGILAGFTTRLAVAGVADFSGLSIDAEGTYSLRATGTEVFTAYAPAPVISNSFKIPNDYVLTAVQINGTDVGKNASVGSILPTTYLGSNIKILFAEYQGPPFPFWNVYLFLETDMLPQDYFTTLVLNGQTFLSADAVYATPGGGVTTWQWGDNTDNEVLPGADDYVVSIT
jgi:hypothetical protein